MKNKEFFFPSVRTEKHRWVFRLGLQENQPKAVLECFGINHILLNKTEQIVLFIPNPGKEKILWELCKKAFFTVPSEKAIELITSKGIRLIE